MRRGFWAALVCACMVVLCISSVAVPSLAGASGLPTYDGSMGFPSIDGPSDPEEFSWEVILEEDQELESIDDQHAVVYYKEDHHPAFGITAAQAHDAVGSAVPTSLAVSAGNVITLTVHHRAGNPAADGAPFVYPVEVGQGWEGGFHTEVVVGPPDEQEIREARERIAREEREALEKESAKKTSSSDCLVPKLKGKSLKSAKKLLRDAECLIGNVRKLKSATDKTSRIVKQSPKPGTSLMPWAPVSVTLAG